MKWGWSSRFDHQIDVRDFPRLARVLAQDRGTYELMASSGLRRAVLRGHWRDSKVSAEGLPAVGDWVLVRDPSEEPLLIESLLERKSVLKRLAPGGGVQLLGANIDVAFVLTSANEDFSVNRVERFVAMALDGGIEARVVLSKVDLHPAPDLLLSELQARLPGVESFAWSATNGVGLDRWRQAVVPGTTAVLLGSSGVGKSTVTNALLGHERQATLLIREGDGKGRHTTVRRELFSLPEGGILLDSPGVRELALDGAEEGVEELFGDLFELAGGCRFRDCAHDREPGCALRWALEEGLIDPQRWRSFEKLRREQRRLQARVDPAVARELRQERRERALNYRRLKKVRIK